MISKPILHNLTIKLGYARVSTKDQNLERQLKKFKELGINDRDIYTDKFTGKEISRPGFDDFLYNVDVLCARGFDVELYFDDISRFSRTSKEGQELYYKLIEKGCKLIFLSTPHINSEVIKERFQSIQNIDMNNLGELGDVIKNLVVTVIKMQVATEFDRVQKDREEKIRMIEEGMARKEVKEKLGKRMVYPDNLEEVMARYLNKEINKREVCELFRFTTSRGVKVGLSRKQLYNNWDKYLEKIGMGEKNEDFKNGSN